MKKICIFGGAFNPVHIGHIKLVENVFKEFNLDKTIIVPSKKPPHKSYLIDSKYRLEMLNLAFKDFEFDVEISDFEIKSEGISYTYKTLKYFRTIYPEDSLSFLTGTDIFATITTWKNWKMLFDYANFIVVNRKETDFETLESAVPVFLKKKITYDNNITTKFGKIHFFKMPYVKISSTEIRNIIKLNKNSEFLPEIVYNYIKENGLYLEV